MTDAAPAFGVPRCITCGYVLTGLDAGQCPECGRSFDPNDAESMSFGARIPYSTRALVEPPGWILITVAALTLPWALIAFSSPAGPDFLLGGLGGLIAACIALVYGARLVIAIGAVVW